MEKVIFYNYSKCSTCREASKWLDQNNINYGFIDIFQEPPSKEFLELALIKFSFDMKKILNTRGKSFKSIIFDIFDSTKRKIIEILSNNRNLIKRPFLIINKSKLTLGFKESEHNAIFN